MLILCYKLNCSIQSGVLTVHDFHRKTFVVRFICWLSARIIFLEFFNVDRNFGDKLLYLAFFFSCLYSNFSSLSLVFVFNLLPCVLFCFCLLHSRTSGLMIECWCVHFSFGQRIDGIAYCY